MFMPVPLSAPSFRLGSHMLHQPLKGNLHIEPDLRRHNCHAQRNLSQDLSWIRQMFENITQDNEIVWILESIKWIDTTRAKDQRFSGNIINMV
jgi:hypothetical protein